MINLKPAIPLVLSALALVPAAVLASQGQVRQHAFSTEGRAFAVSSRLAAKASPTTEQAAIVVPIEIRAERSMPRSEASAQRASSCADWRSLRSGPASRAADGQMVRACEGAPADGSDVPTPERHGVRAATERPRFDFVVDLAAPR